MAANQALKRFSRQIIKEDAHKVALSQSVSHLANIKGSLIEYRLLAHTP
jgi:hypothetical protein